MSAYLIVTAALYLMNVGIALQTKPGAPRGPEPSAGVLMVSALIRAGLAGWALWLLMNGGAA